MKLSVVISVHNQVPLASECYKYIYNFAAHRHDIEYVIIDNASTIPLSHEDFPNAKIVRNEKNIGVYPTFQQGMMQSTGDIVVFLHSDVVIWGKHWDESVVSNFVVNPKLGLLGFVGSNEIDWHGGRGGGTASNFKGHTLPVRGKEYQGSPAEAHGKRLNPNEYMRGAVVDGCVMIIRRDAWNQIGFRENFPPHHFYDRLISTQMLEKGWHVGVLGVAFDHISGQTVNQEKDYHRMAYDWLFENSQKTITGADFYADGTYIKEFDPSMNYDPLIYKIAEDMWLKEYRDKKHLIPIKI